MVFYFSGIIYFVFHFINKKIQSNKKTNSFNKNEKLYNLYLLNQNLCVKCRKIITIGTQHCISCDKCIDNWDHHCFWLNICINRDNYNLFISFTIFLFLEISINIYTYIYISSSIKIFENDINVLNFFVFICIILMIVVLLFGDLTLIRQIYFVIKNKKIEREKIVSLEDFLSNSNILTFNCLKDSTEFSI